MTVAPANRFVSHTAGIRLTEYTHPFAKEFADGIAENSDKPEAWLQLADRLQEAECDCHHIIRALWDDDYQMPSGMSGDISRGSRYWENGQMHGEGVYISYEKDYNSDVWSWHHHYWSNGNWRQMITKDQARKYVSRQGGRYCPKWHNMSVSVR